MLFPEVEFDQEKFLQAVDDKVKKFGYCSVVVSEGVHWPDGRFLAETGMLAGSGWLALNAPMLLAAAETAAEERVLDALLPPPTSFEEDSRPGGPSPATREKFRDRLRRGDLDEKEIEIQVSVAPVGVEIMAPPGMEEMTSQLQGLFQNLGQGRTKRRKLKIRDALTLLKDEEAAKRVNEEDLKLRAVESVEQNGIVFLDELDKVTKRSDQGGSGPDVSREGVQRDLLPLVDRWLPDVLRADDAAHPQETLQSAGALMVPNVRFPDQRLVAILPFFAVLVAAAVLQWEAGYLMWGAYLSSLCFGYTYGVVLIVAGLGLLVAGGVLLLALVVATAGQRGQQRHRTGWERAHRNPYALATRMGPELGRR